MDFPIIISIKNLYEQYSLMGASCPYVHQTKLGDHQQSLDQMTKDPTTHLKIRQKRPICQGRNDQKLAEIYISFSHTTINRYQIHVKFVRHVNSSVSITSVGE